MIASRWRWRIPAPSETNAPRFGDQTVLRRTTAARRYFTSASSLAGDCGEGFAPAGPLGRRFANAAFARPPHLAMGCVFNRPQEPRNG